MTKMKYVALLIFISFLGLAVFSVLAFDHKMDSSMNSAMDRCIGSRVDNIPCPTNLVAAVTHHISVYQAIFNTFIPSAANSIIFLTLLLFTLVFTFLSAKDFLNRGVQPKFLYHRLGNFELIIHKARQKFVSWLSLFENSPSIS